MSEELKPCPFCGGKADVVKFVGVRYQAYCTICNAESGYMTTEQGAVNSWNRRVGNAPAADVAEVRHGHWNVGYFKDWVCSCCIHPANNTDDDKYIYCPNCGARMDGETT